MGRNAHYFSDQFIDAALDIAARKGPSAVTIAMVAGALGAPVGSVYHRFRSRDELLADMWLKVVASFQEGFLARLEKDEGLEAALYTPRWVRSHSAEARVLLLYRREELVTGEWPEDLKAKAIGVKRRLDDGLRDYAERAFGRVGQEEVHRVIFATIDVPYAAVLRFIRQFRRPPRSIDGYIRQTYTAIMGRET